jgi:hypothetical protein
LRAFCNSVEAYIAHYSAIVTVTTNYILVAQDFGLNPY